MWYQQTTAGDVYPYPYPYSYWYPPQPPVCVNPWDKPPYTYSTNYHPSINDVPCAIEEFFRNNPGARSVLLVCSCPRCTYKFTC